MQQKRLAEFDALVGGYYGKSNLLGDPRTRVQDLLATYYGNPAVVLPRRAQPPSVSLSLGCDDGEVLSQPGSWKPTRDGGAMPAAPPEFEEYVIDICGPATPPPDAAAPPATPPAASSPAPPAASPSFVPPPVAAPPIAASPVAASPAPAPAAPPPAAVPPTPAADAPAATSASLSAGEADIVSEIESIIRGQKLYNKEQGLVDRGASPPASAPSSRDAGGSTPYAGVSAQPADGHAIFDRIAQSMSLANAYDLGTVPLENRFAEFDRQEDHKRRVPTGVGGAPPPASPAPYPPPAAAPPQTLAPTLAPTPTRAPPAAMPAAADFMADLDAIRMQPPPQVVSRPFYDTGEHVLAGNGLYAERLRAGKGQAVALSYGQIIAMGDLYDTVDDLLDADPTELNRLKTLVARSTAYYEGKRANARLDVSNDEWDTATQGRYLKLAEGNYEHFSPPAVAMGGGVKTLRGDNRSQWEIYHRRAIGEAQDQFLRLGNNVSPFFERALVINAFGDHFLTDAFASGHLINKEAMIARFRSAFYSGDSLSGAGEKFFERVADRAWVGDLAAKFSQLETVDYPTVHVPWYIGVLPGALPIAGRDLPVPFHPKIDSASRFASVLKEAAKQQPERVGNLIVKALHDHLNEHGIEVTNDAGDGTWILPGDGTLTVGTGGLTPADLAKNLGIMRRAVQQSIDDINGPAIQVSNLNYQALFDGVWRSVPKLTATSQQQMTALIRDHTDPASATLVQAAAGIVTEQLKSFIKLLVDEHKLKPA